MPRLRSLMCLPLLTASALYVGCNGTEDGALPTPELPPGTDEDIGEIIATVSGFPIGSREFEAAAAREFPANGESFTDEEKREILDRIVEEKMLYLHARALGVDRDPKVQKVMINTLLRERVYAEVRNSDFTEEELREYFEAHKEDFVVPEKVQVLRIFIRGDRDRTMEEARALAEDLYLRLQADPTQFKTIAAEHSEDPYRRRGGDLGFMSAEGKPGIDPAVVEKAFELDVDQLSAPFEAGGGYNIIMVAGKRDRVERTFAQMKGAVLRKVKAERYRELYDQYVDQIDDAFTVSIDESALSHVDPRPSRRPPLSTPPAGLRGIRGLRNGDGPDVEDEGTE